MSDGLRVLRLIRDTPGPGDLTGHLGTVADAVIFPDGVSVLHWRTHPAGVEIYSSEASLRTVREGSGRSHFEEG